MRNKRTGKTNAARKESEGAGEQGPPSPESLPEAAGAGAAPAPPGSPGRLAAALIQRLERDDCPEDARLREAIPRPFRPETGRDAWETGGRAGDLHPAVVPWLAALDRVEDLWQAFRGLGEPAPLAKLIAKAEDEYMPSGPPTSPLTRSWFWTWAFFDARGGPDGETFGAILRQAGAVFGMDEGLLDLLAALSDSRMGVYESGGSSGGRTRLRDLVSGEECRALVPSGHRSRKGDLLYLRVLPPRGGAAGEPVVLTLPYLLLHPGIGEWRAYFRRVLPEGAEAARIQAGAHHLKQGPAWDYWHEFVFEAYVDYRSDVIYLTGLPDIPESRPHSSVNRDRY